MKISLVDTHAHLNFSDDKNNLDSIIKSSLSEGVEKIICVSSDIESSKNAIEIANIYPGVVYAGVGVHPQKTDPENKESLEIQLKQLEELAQQKEVAVIGEFGLDFSPAPPGELDRSKEDQYYLFEEQIKIALKYELPVNIHSRKSTEETVNFLIEKYHYFGKMLKGVLHCYSAGKKNINRLVEIGFYFGIDGNLTYDEGLQNVVKNIPIENIILETDSPFLAPLPFRGLRNEPKNVKLIAEFLAQLKNVSISEIAKITTKNAQDLFRF